MSWFHWNKLLKPGGRVRPTAAPRNALMEGLEGRTLLSALTIAQENQLPGAPKSQWDVKGAGDPTLQGYATDMSVNVGTTVNFKIDDTSRSPYFINVYRMGYYGGDGARLVTTIPAQETAAVDQPAPVTDPTTGLVDAGNWSVTARWAVPADATSGIYFAKLTRVDTGGSSHVVFVVRNDASHADVLFQTSDMTWQAYNTWGGTSLYRGNGPGGAPAAGRAYAVSYNRPFDNRATPGNQGANSWVFYDEYPMVRFLEADGYNVSYQAGLDTARLGPANIEQHKIFMSVGHDEYWSGRQRRNVTKARDAGVNLAFMSGNEMFWKSRCGPSIDGSNTPGRTLVCYKESEAARRSTPRPSGRASGATGGSAPTAATPRTPSPARSPTSTAAPTASARP